MRTNDLLCTQDFLGAWASSGKRLLITGPSGSGKSYTLDALRCGGNPVFELDCVGREDGGQWLVNPFAIPRGYRVWGGCCDNIVEVIHHLRPDYVVFVKPSKAYMAQHALRLKAEEVGSKHTFYQHWLNKSICSTTAFWRAWHDSVQRTVYEINYGLDALEQLGVPTHKPNIRAMTNVFKAVPSSGWHEWRRV